MQGQKSTSTYHRDTMAKKIIKGKIGNAITSVADDHIVVVSEDVFDEKYQMYQSEINDIAMSGVPKWEGEYEGEYSGGPKWEG